jgi:hypothetical protein
VWNSLQRRSILGREPKRSFAKSESEMEKQVGLETTLKTTLIVIEL